MKFIKLFIHGLRLLVLGALVFSEASAGAAGTNSVRLAIGPFFAPAGNQPLENIAATLPDLLTASLSQQNRFQLVEREKVNAIWSELHLTEAGLTSADAVGKLGRMLSCDWLVSGSFVRTGSNTQIWVKVINTQDSVVLDLQAVPYDGTNFSATADAIARFLVQTRSRLRPREFIALGKFEDQSVSPTRENWAPRLLALLEKYFLAAGYGVVERDAVGPIFSEYQFQAAGFTGDSTNRVKLKPAFWIVDGGCKWIHDTEDKLSVTIRIQKMGGGEQTSNFTESPGEILEKVVISIVQSMLTQMGSTTVEEAQAGEEKIRAAHLEELAKGRGETPPRHYATNQTFISVTNPNGGTRQIQVDPAFLAQQERHAQETLKTLQQAILLNPKDMRSKWMLGMSWYCSRDAGEKQHGQALLEEVAASGDATYALKAKNWLADFKSGRLTLEPDRLGNLEIVTRDQPASIPAVKNPPVITADSLARAGRNSAMATRVQSAAVIPSNVPVTGRYEGDITAVKFWRREVLIASGTTLQTYNLDSGETADVRLPLKLKHPITTIEASQGNLWLGTDGGLIHVSLTDGTTREFGEKDGFPTPGITALRLVEGRLFIGFGFQKSGALGYLDLATEKFTGLMNGASLHRSWKEAVQNAPEVPVHSITTLDGNSIWVATELALQHLDLASKKWNLATSGQLSQIGGVSENSIAITPRYLAVPDPMGGVAICKLPGTTWTSLDLADDVNENAANALATDPANPDYLWIGGSQGRVTLLDLAGLKIIAQGQLPSPGMVKWIFATQDKVVVIAGGENSSICNLHCINQSMLWGTTPQPVQIAGQLDTDPRRRFLQRNFLKFVPVQFQKNAKGDALVQRLHVQKNMFESGDRHYCGFRFTVPAWIDGDFELMYALAKNEAEKDFSGKAMYSDIIPETGDSAGFHGYMTRDLVCCPKLKEQLPYTRHVTTRHLGSRSLEPGKTYGVWFEFDETNLPDIAFVMTVDSKRGNDEFGLPPLCDADPIPVISRAPPDSAEQLRSEVESALKAKDKGAILSLIYWQDVSRDMKFSASDGLEETLTHEIASVKLAPLPPFTWTSEVNGIRTRPSVPLIGVVDIKYKDGDGTSLPYGKIGSGFYISINVKEPVTK